MPEEAKQEQSTPQTQQTTAPAKQATETTTPKVEAGAKSQEGTTETKAIHGLKTDLFKARAKARDSEDAFTKINSRLEALAAKVDEVSSKKSDDWKEPITDSLDVDKFKNSILQEAETKIETKLKQRDAEAHREYAAIEANNWLLSREHLKTDVNALKEIGDILNLDYYQNLIKNDPRAAARSAYLDWCEQKGIGPDAGNSTKGTPQNSMSPKGGMVKSNTDEVDATHLQGVKYGTPEYKERIKQIERAALEGKYKGKVIKI